MKKNDNKEQSNYKAEIFEFLDKLPACVKSLDELCKPENREKFIAVVKSYINEKGRGQNCFDLDFNSDYSEIHKFDLVL